MIKCLISFGAGLGIGAGASYLYWKQKKEKEISEERAELAKFYHEKYEVKPNVQTRPERIKVEKGKCEEIRKAGVLHRENVTEYVTRTKKYAPTPDPAEMESPEEDEPDIFEVDSEEAAEAYGYETIGVTYYYEDKILSLNEADEDEDEVIMDEHALVGNMIDDLRDEDVGDVFYIINKRCGVMVEMDVVEGSYQEYVLGVKNDVQ